MQRFLLAAVVAAVATPALAQVGVSINVGEPGFYGRIDIGDYPQPQMIYSKPVIIERGPVDRGPIYLHVPPGYASHWDKHCHEYNACGERVYFVQNDWYQREYVPRYQAHHRDEHRDDHRDDHRDNHRDEHHNDDHGPDHGPDHDRDR